MDTISREKTLIKISNIQIHPPLQSRIILAVSLAKSQRFNFLIEKCTELGADHIAAVQFERTVKQGNLSSMKRYTKICISAAKQSGQIFLPRLSGPKTFPKIMKEFQNEYPQALWIFGGTDPESKPFSLINIPCNYLHRDIIAVIGPEGGFTESEKIILRDLGADQVQINRNILRIETAAIAFCSLLSLIRS